MQQYAQFFLEHWFLSALFIIIVALIIFTEMRMSKSGGNRVKPKQAINMINRDNAVVVDIRSAEQYKKGHIVGAKNVEANDLEQTANKLQKYKKKPIILVCPSGVQSPKLGEKLKTKGFENVHILAGGLKAWRDESLPLAKKGD